MVLSDEPSCTIVQPGQRGGVSGQAIHKYIYPDTSKAIIAVTHCPNRAMHKISNLFNRLRIIFLRSNLIDKDIMKFEDTCGGRERLFSSPVTVLYTH